MEHFKFRVGAIKNILYANDKGMEEMDKLYKFYKADYEKRTGKTFDMNSSEFNDMVTQNIRNQFRELVLLTSMLGLFLGTGFMAPPDDDEGKAAFSFTKRGIDQIINELSFYYNPTNIQDILTNGIFPAVGTLSDAENVITSFAGEVTGMDFKSGTTTPEDVRAHEHPIKYFMKFNPGARQFVNWLPLISPDMAKAMETKPPPTHNF
jgi:hypothetical protein